jgi:hypothetical protein
LLFFPRIACIQTALVASRRQGMPACGKLFEGRFDFSNGAHGGKKAIRGPSAKARLWFNAKATILEQ